MPTDDRDDPGADTAMFRAYVEEPREPAPAPETNRTLVIGLIVAIVVLVVVAALLLG
jgi:hypothetical protein